MLLKILFPVVYFVSVAYSSDEIDCNDGGFYIRADPKSVSHFYKCDHGRAFRFKCPDGLNYNPKLFVCDWPSNIDKTTKETGPTSTSNEKPSHSKYEQSSKPITVKPAKDTNTNVQPGFEPPSHHQHYNNENEVLDWYPVQIIDNNVDLDGLGYENNPKIDIRKAF